MIAVIRLVIIGVFVFLSSILLLLICFLRPRNVKNAYFAAWLYGKVSWLLGIKVTVLGKENIPEGSCIYVANHQSNYDIFLFSAAVPPRTVSAGKKSILYIPFFGLIYWLLGNIFIERANKVKAMQTLQNFKARLISENISVLLFPEGTRNFGNELLPFKMGAFYLAVHAELPVVPICTESYYREFRLNRLKNGEVIIKFLLPVTQDTVSSHAVRKIAATVYERMNAEIAMLDKREESPK